MSDRPILLVANRGEIAVRIIRSAAELGFGTVAVYADDDSDSPHVGAADSAVALGGVGPAAYLNRPSILDAARATRATLVHPGYGFLSENADFARECAEAGLTFVGPTPDLLNTFGDKALAREAAAQAGIPVLTATSGGASLGEIREFFDTVDGGVMIKAVAGGGGRGMREVLDAAGLDEAFRVCTAEAELGFGASAVYAEQLLIGARHIEVQVVSAADGDGVATAVALGDRDCSVQQRRQKLIEIAPAQRLSDDLRARLHAAAARLCARVGYRGVATVEFLAGAGSEASGPNPSSAGSEASGPNPSSAGSEASGPNLSGADAFVFLEVNPRIQVEHTITEEVTGTDLIATQLAIAMGASFDELALPAGVTAGGAGSESGSVAVASGVAIQVRVNTTGAGTLTEFVPPSGAGIRVDTCGRPGLVIGPRYDPLLAKVIAHARSGGFDAAVRKAVVALDEFRIGGVGTNLSSQRAILTDDDFRTGTVDARWLQAGPESVATPSEPVPAAQGDVVSAPMAGIVVEIAAVGSTIGAGGQVAVLEAMKMQHVVAASSGIVVDGALVTPGQSVAAGEPLIAVTPDDSAGGATIVEQSPQDRVDLAEIVARHEVTLDSARPEAVRKRHSRGRRTARENIADLVDDGSFVEYGALAIAAQRSRRTEADLIENTPADGLVGGTATVGAERFGAGAEVVVMSYDYTVLAGTQGLRNHAKTDRLLALADRKRVPLILFAEGGGGRPGDTDWNGNGLDVPTFRAIAALNSRVPTVSIVSGRCFAGNAALAGACDVLIATPDANIGMGGPAMVDGGGLGVFAPEDIGPIEVQRRNGVVDLVADDEAHAVALAKRYLGYFQGDVDEWECPDADLARQVVPENRLRAYDVGRALTAIADVGSVLELRPEYGVGVVTALVRVEGAAYGVLANSSRHLGGAIDAEAADKATDFLALCEAHRLPLVMLCDTPGFMVGPASEHDATVRRFGRMFIAGARLTVPFGAIILRKGYGLGAMAMTGGSFHAPEFTVAWPTGEIGPMGLEGAVRLGFRKELDAVEDPAERDKMFNDILAAAYEQGKALRSATAFELDDVIDPADSRRWIRTLRRTRR